MHQREPFLPHRIDDAAAGDLAHEVFGRGEAAGRQLAMRAGANIEAGRPRFPTSHEQGHRLAAAFQAAVASGDTEKDAVLYSDGGGRIVAIYLTRIPEKLRHVRL